MRAAALAVAVIALACAGGSAYALRVPAAPKCTVFPKSNPWNRRVDKLPVARNSAAVIASIGVDTGLHADFGSGLWEGSPIGIPFDVVTRKTPRAKVGFEYADESDRIGYPIPKRVHIEGGSDHHALLLDRDACRLYELGGLEQQGGRWHAWAGATWSLRSNHVRPVGWTSADAAGLPIFPGLARWDEAKRGVIDHALRFTVQRTRRAYLYPARHYASSLTDANLPPMGLRVRLKASFDIRPYPRQARIVLTSAEALRDAGRRQRLELVHQRRAEPRLVERPAAHARQGHRLELRGRRHLEAQALAGIVAVDVPVAGSRHRPAFCVQRP